MIDRLASINKDGEFEFVLVCVTCVSKMEGKVRTGFIVKDYDGRERTLYYGGVDLSYSEGHRVVVCWKDGIIVWVKDLEARAPGGKVYRVGKVNLMYELLRKPPEVRLPVLERDRRAFPWDYPWGGVFRNEEE